MKIESTATPAVMLPHIPRKVRYCRVTAKQSIDSLQVLRGIAATSVALHHAFRAFTSKLPDGITLAAATRLASSRLIDFGAFGVDTFFILSGFLMVYISKPYIERRKRLGDFLAHRAIRIWPLYVLITAVVCVADWARHDTFDLRPARLLSFLFLPSFDDAGAVRPILGVGWTLNYEVMFYLAFAATLLMGRHILVALAVILGVLFLFGRLLPPGVTHSFLGDTVTFEFLTGALIATFSDRLPFKAPMLWLAAGLLLLAVVGPPQEGAPQRFAEQGIAAALIFVGTLHANCVRWPRWLLKLGDASYSIYLVHMLVIYFAVLPVVRRMSALWHYCVFQRS